MNGGEPDEKIVAVIGLGYVGLALALLFLRKGFRVIGIDTDGARIRHLLENMSYISDIADDEIAAANSSGRFDAGSDFEKVSTADAIVICVPTPLDGRFEPDLHHLRQAGASIRPFLRKGQLVVLESSTYPGTTEEVLLPLLSFGGLEAGRDLFVGYSPERIDPGSLDHRDVESIPKIVSGVTDACRQRIIRLYERVFHTVVPVSSVRTAEMVKIVENSQRLVNISFMNELSRICRADGISIWEVIEAAATKPYGFTAYFPGPGVGGHCIPVDPLYLKWKAGRSGLQTRFIDIAHEINQAMPQDVVQLVCDALKTNALAGKKILVVGVAYKKDVNDARESPAKPVIQKLIDLGASVCYHDPYIPTFSLGAHALTSVALAGERIRQCDCVLILADHTRVDYDWIAQEAALIVDTRNATRGISGRTRVVRL